MATGSIGPIIGGRVNTAKLVADWSEQRHRIAALEADLARATALLHRLVGWQDDPCHPITIHGGPEVDWCVQHGTALPCVIGEARAWLEQQEQTT